MGLHQLNIAHRDLKLENLLLNDRGHLKLADFGLAKIVIGQTWTSCGTPEYMAPEIVKMKGHGRAADWWSFGVLVYELFAGTTPFVADSVLQIYRNINAGTKYLDGSKSKWMSAVKSKWASAVVKAKQKHLVESLLVAEPSRRLPVQEGVDALRKQPLFPGGIWDSLNEPTMRGPYVPEIDMNTICKKTRKADVSDLQVPFAGNCDWDKDF